MGIRRAAGSVVLTLLLGLPGAAAADEPLRSSGSLVYAWEGDPARGCATAGVCGVRGAIVLQPTGRASFSRSGATGEIFLDGAAPTVRVEDSASGETCVDKPAGFGGIGLLQLSRGSGGSLAATPESAPSSGRCAGPLAQDLGRISLAGQRSAGRRPSFDFRGSVGFTAGPYSGTLVSTLQLSPAPPSFGSSGSSSSSSGPGSAGPAEQIHLRYRLDLPAGRLQIPFRGEAGPFCAALGTCGASGSLLIAWPARRLTLDLFGARAVNSPPGRRRVLADFRAGRLPIEGAPAGPVPTSLTETFTSAAGLTCTDAQRESEQLAFGSPAARTGVTSLVTLSSFSSFDALRTHCPGPQFADVFGQTQNLLTGTISARRLLARHSTIVLSVGGGFAAPGFAGARNGRLSLSMTLVKVAT